MLSGKCRQHKMKTEHNLPVQSESFPLSHTQMLHDSKMYTVPVKDPTVSSLILFMLKSHG